MKKKIILTTTLLLLGVTMSVFFNARKVKSVQINTQCDERGFLSANGDPYKCIQDGIEDQIVSPAVGIESDDWYCVRAGQATLHCGQHENVCSNACANGGTVAHGTQELKQALEDVR